ncbi:ATP-binding protein [Hydrogenophaga sp. RWCD_12]|uniref:ATP-binding protein n=1 Tax=Hydrogenophaga sp. RWCD_12 TaxID=3391190 RepID=UPI003984780D
MPRRHPTALPGRSPQDLCPLKRRQLLLGGLALGLSLPAGAAEVIRYAGDAAFPPFESLDPQGQPQGFQIDLLRELEPLLGVSFAISLQPWAQTEAAFREGRADLIAMVQTSERQAWTQFVHGHATPAIAVYRKKDAVEPQDVSDLKGLRIAVPDREPMRETLQNWLPQLTGPFVKLKQPELVLAAVEKGEADVALLPRAYADPLLERGVAPGVVASALVLKVQSYAFAVHPGEQALQERLQKGLHELERNGRLEALRVKWLSSHRDVAERHRLELGLSQQKTWTWGVAAASALGLGVLGTVAWKRGRRILQERARRRTAEAALHKAEQLLERSFTLHPEPMLLVERGKAVIRDTNAALQTLLGVPARTLVGRPMHELGAHIDAAALQALVRSFGDHGGLDAVPVRLMRADGSTRECLVSADPLTIGGVEHAFCLLRDVTEQLEQDAALRQGYDTLAAELDRLRRDLDKAQGSQQRAEQSLQEFTRVVSHDLRAPLIAMQGFVGLLRERLRGGHLQEAEQYTEHIDRAARRMNTMVSALTEMAKVSRRPLQRVTVDMQQLVRDTWTLLSAAQAQRQVDFKLDQLPIAHADPDLTAQVWQNLLHNAWKYSGKVAQAKVSVDSFRDARGIWYRVTDNGAGFDMTKAGQLFQPFQRMHSATQFEGSGVGLSLVRRIVEHHGGEIRLRSAPAVGTVAEFTLDPPPDTTVPVN